LRADIAKLMWCSSQMGRLVEEKFLEEFLSFKKRKEFRLMSVLIQSGMKSTLERFSDAV